MGHLRRQSIPWGVMPVQWFFELRLIVITRPSPQEFITENQERGTNLDLPAVRTVPRSTSSPGPVAASGKSSMESITRQGKNVSGPGIVRQTSLRAKLSLPNVRRHRSQEDGECRDRRK